MSRESIFLVGDEWVGQGFSHLILTTPTFGSAIPDITSFNSEQNVRTALFIYVNVSTYNFLLRFVTSSRVSSTKRFAFRHMLLTITRGREGERPYTTLH